MGVLAAHILADAHTHLGIDYLSENSKRARSNSIQQPARPPGAVILPGWLGVLHEEQDLYNSFLLTGTTCPGSSQIKGPGEVLV